MTARRNREAVLPPVGGITPGGCPCGFWSRYACAYARLHGVCTHRAPR